MKFEIYSRKMLAYAATTESCFPHAAVIEIVTYDGDDDLGFDHFAAHLKLVFSDVDMPDHPGAMRTDQAQQIVNFINSLEGDIDTIITSCEAGMSRSPAIAAAIMIALDGDDKAIWSNTAYSPNPFCYRMVLKAFEKDDSAVEDKAAMNLAVWNAALKSNEGPRLIPKDIFHGIVGLCVGDALGVPVEFTPRSDLARYPVDDMVGYGVHGQDPGTWSDDTGLTLALMDGLSSGVVDYNNIMDNFSDWLNDGGYTSSGVVFDVGNTTSRAISNYSMGTAPLKCGGQTMSENGNGSLMRILPAMYFLVAQHGGIMGKGAIETIHALSSLTHAHNISKMACVIYCNVAFQVMTCRQICRRDISEWSDVEFRRPYLHQFVTTGIQEALAYYSAIPEYAQDYVAFERLEDREFRHYLPSEIKSSGYVVDTLEAAIWCLLNNSGYSDTVLAAVNLGSDTDTTAAVAGGLAGLFYQDDTAVGIPKHWINEIINLDLVKVLCNKFSRTICADQTVYEYWGEDQ